MLAYNFFRVALVAVLALLLVRPAAAVVEQVPPESGGYLWEMTGGFSATTPEPACASYAQYYGYLGATRVVFNTTIKYRCETDSGGWIFLGYIYRSGVEGVCPVAEPPYTFNASTGFCEREGPSCPAAGTNISSGFYDVGTVPGALSSDFRLRCDSGCLSVYSGGSIGWRVMVDGIYHYFVLGRFDHMGQECTTGETSPGVVTALPTTSCGTGQSLVTGEGGFAKCYDISTGIFTDSNSASAVAATVAAGDAAYADMMDSTAARITAMGGTASDVVAAQTVAAGVFAAGGSSGAASGGDEVMNAFCADNPTASVCAEQDFGTVEDVNLTENTINVSITPVAVGGAGSCPAPSSMVLHGQTYYFVWDTYCNFATGIKPILLAFGWLAAAGILIGGFRS